MSIKWFGSAEIWCSTSLILAATQATNTNSWFARSLNVAVVLCALGFLGISYVISKFDD